MIQVWNLCREEKALEIYEEVLRCIQIGLLCVQENDKDRTTMSAVVLMLNSEIVLLPKELAYIKRRKNKDTDLLVAMQGSYYKKEVTITEIEAR